MSKKRSNPRPARTEPSLEQWEALYEVAGNLKKLAPWRALCDTDILVLQLPGQSEPVYCSVMGQGGMSYGISVYPGHESFLRLKRVIDQDGHSPELLMLEQKCLACNFGDREEIEAKDRDVMKQLGLRFRGRNQWIYFRSMTPGQFPWYLDAEQADLLIQALQNLAMLCLCYMEGKLEVDFDAGETLTRWYDPEKDMWMNAVIPMPVPRLERTLDLQDELLLARLKRSKKTGTRLEVDSFYIPIPVQEDKLSPPVGVHMALLADKGSGLILNQNIANPDDPEYALVPSMLVDYMEEHGRPAAVYVRSEWMGTLLRNTCKAVGVRLVEDEGVPVLDELLDGLMGSLMMGLLTDGDFE
ncbi:MAG: hypothetical protein K2N78_12840 [Oscillospiraceae bacterium]|nr:hypothetical protein [Oscillospiraceae bacterium]